MRSGFMRQMNASLPGKDEDLLNNRRSVVANLDEFLVSSSSESSSEEDDDTE